MRRVNVERELHGRWLGRKRWNRAREWKQSASWFLRKYDSWAKCWDRGQGEEQTPYCVEGIGRVKRCKQVARKHQSKQVKVVKKHRNQEQ